MQSIHSIDDNPSQIRNSKSGIEQMSQSGLPEIRIRVDTSPLPAPHS